MLNTWFQGIFSGTSPVISVGNFLLCVGVSLLIGLFLAGTYAWRGRCTGSFLVTLAVLPCVVCVVIMMVNGNIGAGVAVAGAFSLVRFRSVPGTAREIGELFLAMAAGLMAGMGYLGYASLFTVILGTVTALYQTFAKSREQSRGLRILRITVPEELDYSGVFQDILERYTSSYRLNAVKTTNLGSLFRLTYEITMRDPKEEKELIDALRCRNGNLEIGISRQEANPYDL